MIIGIDYTAALKQGGGIGRYTRGLITTLAQIDQQTEYRLLASSDAPIDSLNPFQKYPNFSHKSYPFPERWMTIGWHRLYLPIPVEWFTGQVDLFHSPNFILPPVRRAKTLLTVHDLSFIRHPQGAVVTLRNWLNKVVPRSLARADHILADSESTKVDLFDIYNVSPNRVTVVGAGVEERFHPITEQATLTRVAEHYQLPERFILGLGTLEPRKNFKGLIEAFSTSAVSKTHYLVIAGGKGWLYDDIFAAAENSPVKERIQFIGFVDDADLPALYTLADIFAYPSHYEGFGIPVVEAMACGTPVVCADNSSLPEVAGQAAIQVTATDTEMLASALHLLATDRDQYTQAINNGFLQAQKFSWVTAANRLQTVYQQLLN
ncbi:glycosyltransferase family 1 protein [Anaerolineales bacterium HSG25]|nr:glycosyltransferase family 1 protein [Anaerolineales bacterium HSG25]